MGRWRFLNKSKKDKKAEFKESAQKPSEDDIPTEGKTEESVEPAEKTLDEPLAEYSEALYTADTKSKTNKESNYGVWRNIGEIENKVDDLHITRARKPDSEMDKKIDRIVADIKVEQKETTRKPSNVIYVVNRPQPGQVRGDWAVRGHGKIYSQHRTKEKAIKAARKVAKARDATVMVQNTDGTFSEGFKPR
jgi:hypothetical protein